MLPTSHIFGGHATHLKTLTPSLLYAKRSTPDVQNEPKRSDWKSESVCEWDWRGASFRLSDSIGGVEARCIQKPARTFVYGQRRVYVISRQRSGENSAAGGGVGDESA